MPGYDFNRRGECAKVSSQQGRMRLCWLPVRSKCDWFSG